MAFGNPLGEIKSILMCMQNFIQKNIYIPHGSRVRAFFFFRILTLAKHRTMNNDISQVLGTELVNIYANAKILFKIFHKVEEIRPVSFQVFRIWSSVKPRPMTNGCHSPGLHLINTIVSVNIYPNNPYGSRVMANFL